MESVAISVFGYAVAGCQEELAFMRVLVIADAGTYGGTLRFFERLLSIHSKHGIFTDVLISSEQCSDTIKTLAECYGAKIHSGVNRKQFTTSPVLTPLYDFLFSWLAVRRCQPDLIVVSTATPGSMSVVLYCPVPVLYILHSYAAHRFRLLPRLYLGLGTLLNNKVMTVSHASADAISQTMGIRHDRIAVVHNSIQPVNSPTMKREPIVLTAGHLVPYKNPETWLAVAERVVSQKQDVIFVWLGDGELLEQLRDKVKRQGLAERILFPGYVVDTASWYAKAQVYFQPSLLESHGIAVLEAMTHRLPCVVAEVGGLRESVVDRLTGYTGRPDDTEFFSKRIIELLDNSRLRLLMGEAGKSRATELFSEGEQEKKILGIYQGLAKRKFI